MYLPWRYVAGYLGPFCIAKTSPPLARLTGESRSRMWYGRLIARSYRTSMYSGTLLGHTKLDFGRSEEEKDSCSSTLILFGHMTLHVFHRFFDFSLGQNPWPSPRTCHSIPRYGACRLRAQRFITSHTCHTDRPVITHRIVPQLGRAVLERHRSPQSLLKSSASRPNTIGMRARGHTNTKLPTCNPESGACFMCRSSASPAALGALRTVLKPLHSSRANLI